MSRPGEDRSRPSERYVRDGRIVAAEASRAEQLIASGWIPPFESALVHLRSRPRTLAVALTTLSSKRLQEREGRWLKLVSGAVLVMLGGALMLRPELLHW